MDDETIKKQAEEFARANRKQIAQAITDKTKYPSDDEPVSIFMAGSPGAGKTEYSKNLIYLLERDKRHKVIRIDADELRQHLPGYTGNNSYLFQIAVSLIVERIHDLALDNHQTFLLDGTFSNYKKASDNINRSLNKKRTVLVHYVYQKPEVAWKFTKERDVVEGRHIPKDAFINQFLESRETVTRIRKDFDSRVVIYLARKNFETHAVSDIIEIKPEWTKIDDYLGEQYTKEKLMTIL